MQFCKVREIKRNPAITELLKLQEDSQSSSLRPDGSVLRIFGLGHHWVPNMTSVKIQRDCLEAEVPELLSRPGGLFSA